MFICNFEYNLFTVDVFISFLDIFGNSSNNVVLLLNTIIAAISLVDKLIFESTDKEGSFLSITLLNTYESL